MFVVVIISANIEWDAIERIFPDADLQVSPYGQWFETHLDIKGGQQPVIFFHGGWGKISAASSAQYAIDQWSPNLVVNLGTCGGFESGVEKDTIVLVERTVVYDIVEQMLDAEEAIRDYTTEIDLSWLSEPYPHPVLRTVLVSADRDLVAEDISVLKSKYGAVAGDWESGAIAWVANRNKVRCLILRGVTDLVGAEGGEAYEGNVQIYVENTERIMNDLVLHLPNWIEQASRSSHKGSHL
ncbi:MAG: hypothetical protein OXI24_12710 [Candidatus Poribacteria bacterium]|nr:hypothetical protein [Candidatus Poribacteria bacterium]